MSKPKTKEDDNGLVFFAKMNATSFAAFTMVLILLVSLAAYSVGVSKGIDLGAEQNAAGMAYPQSVSECVVYTDEVLITGEDCTSHVDCAPNGICISDIEKCAYFIN